MRKLVPLLLLLGSFAHAGEINVLTDLGTPFPPGCIALELPAGPAHADNELWDETVPAPSIHSDSLDAQVRIVIWRVGCPDDDFSVVMVRLQTVSGGPVLVPQVFAEAGLSNFPLHQAQLITRPAPGNVGATGDVITTQATTFMLAVEPFPTQGSTVFLPDDYNDEFTLEFFWGDFSTAGQQGELFPVFAYDPQFDPPQFSSPVLHGRHSGQYVVEGMPRQGLVLQVAELADPRNYVFAIFFTYIDGEPVWVVGNTEGAEPGPSGVTINMEIMHGGEFVTTAPGSYDREDVITSTVGALTLEVIDCHRLRGTYDFSAGGFGTGELIFDRLVRIAGYDCNPWD